MFKRWGKKYFVFDFCEFVLKMLVKSSCSIFWYFRGQRSGAVCSRRWYRMSEGIVIGVVQSEKCDTGNGTFKQNYFENTLTFVSKPSPDHSTRPYPEKTNICLLA